MKKLVTAGIVIILAILVLPVVWVMLDDKGPDTEAVAMLPWQIEALPDGTSRVFGLTLGESLVGDARARFGPDVDIAIVAPRDRAPLLEAYYESVNAGFVTGKIILTADIEDDELSAMRERALKESYMESVTRKITLRPEDVQRAREAPIRVITFIPSARLDETVIRQRFGEPAQRVQRDDDLEHLQYPMLGLDVALGRRGQTVMQYVAPRQFELLALPDEGAESPAE
ncbi:hypothetical protein [Azoarcus taiwanensis]|uniref:Uncharacterized protein n=1 Tax=Azoarcus taiwanensis TaxID=666964 RepID=A0A972F9A1_9RHOO|nr:hypothetical protein [Azoarcus taiwanensis]NMG04482.1 hypothetical protein [Azoarcus taiwanensis]